MEDKINILMTKKRGNEKMNDGKKWTYRLGFDVRWMHDTYKTKDEAIVEGIKEAKKRNAKEVFIGEAVQDAIPVIDVDDVIDNIVMICMKHMENFQMAILIM